MNTPARIIESFYAAFQRRDHVTMAAAYLPTATFTDPVFGTLEGGWQIGAMWRMLCERAADLVITTGRLHTEADHGSIIWRPRYTFSATGRSVENVISSTFYFEDGMIRSQTDTFNLYRWCRQALGFKGILLGWSPLVQNAVRGQAARGLQQFITRHRLDPEAR